MSDDRWLTDGDEPYMPAPPAPKRPKPWFQDVKPRTVTADEIEAFLDVYCAKLGIDRGEKKQPKGRK